MNCSGNNLKELSSDYFEKTKVMVYLEDALSQLLVYKDENPKINPNKFLHSYFSSVKRGSHVLFREFKFIIATLLNRISFIKNYWKAFGVIGNRGELLSIQEYFSMALLLCPDFQKSVIQKAAKILYMDDSGSCSLLFSDFLYAFQLQLCFMEFLSKSHNIFISLLENQNKCSTSTNDKYSKGVNAKLFYETIHYLFNDDMISPPKEIIRIILHANERITFFEFLTLLWRSELLNSHLNALPQKRELFLDIDRELNLTPIDEKFE